VGANTMNPDDLPPGFEVTYMPPVETQDQGDLPPGFELSGPQTLGDRWKNAGADPDSRRKLAIEIGRSFGEKQYAGSDPSAVPGISKQQASAFSKTGRDLLAFGMGRRKLRKEAMKTFPGLTKEEASIVADEADRIQFKEKPGATAAGGAVGLVGNIGALGGGLGAAGRVPGIIGNVARGATISKDGTLVGNVARGAVGGAAGAEAYAQIADERNATPVELGVSAGLGGALPGIVQSVGGWLGRGALPTQEAARRIGRDIGEAGAQRADEFAAATGEALPTAAGALDPNSALTIARSTAGGPRASTAIENSVNTTDTALMRGMSNRVDETVPLAASSARITNDTKDAASAFMAREISPGVPQREVRINLDPSIHRALLDAVNILDRNVGEVPLDGFLRRALDTNELSLGQFNTVRKNLESTVEFSSNPELSKNVSQLIRGAVDQVDKVSAKGYAKAVIDDYAAGMRQAEGAQAGGKILSSGTPSELRSAATGPVVNQPAASVADRITGAGRGAAQALRDEFGAGRPSARSAARAVSEGDVAAKVADIVPGGQSIVDASGAYSNAADAARLMRPAGSVADGVGVSATSIGMGVGGSQYFAYSAMEKLVRALSLPPNVRNEVTRMLTDPARVEDAIAAMRRGGVRDQDIARVVRTAAPAMTGSIAQQTMSDADGRKMTPTEYQERLVSNMVSTVSRAMYDLRGRDRSNTSEELDAVEERMIQLLGEGRTPEQAIDTVMSELPKKK